MTFDELKDLAPGIWVEQCSTYTQFIRVADSENSTQEFSSDETNILSGAFLNTETGVLLHASYLIDDAEILPFQKGVI